MNGKWTSVLLCLMVMIVIAAIGCGDEATPPTGRNNGSDGGFEAVSFAGFTELVEQIAPPVYTAAAASPSSSGDSLWTYGECPLLGKVFSETEPMSLYTNIADLDMYLEELAEITSELDSMDIQGDTIIVGSEPGGDFSMEVQTLTTNTSIPTQCQIILGFSSVDLETLIKMESTEGDNAFTMHGAYTITDSTQKIMTYCNSSNGTLTESNLFYAFVNLTDSTIDIRGVFFKDYGDDTSARWGYAINTVNESDFAYRMSWFSEELIVSLLGCIIGGGNKDVLFALKYRQYEPADTNVVDSAFILDQTFDSSYGYVGTGIAEGYESFVVESNIFTMDAMPTALLTSPWAE